MDEKVEIKESIGAGACYRPKLEETVESHAHMRMRHMRWKHWEKNPKTGLDEPVMRWAYDPWAKTLAPDPDFVELLCEDENRNLITNISRRLMHTLVYGTAAQWAAWEGAYTPANGMYQIALSNDPVTETATSTTLSNEIAANGLTRAAGTVTLPTVAGNQTTIDKTFTCATAPQSAQKAALFDKAAGGGGAMGHVLAFTQRSLQITDTLQITYTITLA